MSLTPSDTNRLSELLLDPREGLDVEFKGWLDLASKEEHKATLAKALLALANHGGGFLVIGFDEGETGPAPSAARPATLDAYSQDLLNAIVQNYAEPAFHCSVHYVSHPTSGAHPVISVPGGHRVPIRAKRSGPNNQTVQQHAIYVRRPGPRSEQPLSGREWDELFARCIDARRDELLDRIRDLLTGRLTGDRGVAPPRLDDWARDCERIWRENISAMPAESPSRCPDGFFTFAYEIDGATKPSLADLLEVLRGAPQLTGWNTWWVPTRHEIAPYVKEGAIECWIGGDTSEHHTPRDPAHADFWRVSPDGLAFLLRGYAEDGDHARQSKISPGTILDPSLPIWRAGEGLLHSAYLARQLAGNAVSFKAVYTGLRGRQFVQWASPMDFAWASGICKEESVSVATRVGLESLDSNLVEVVQALLAPLYERFDFTRLPIDVVQRELNRLRKRD